MSLLLTIVNVTNVEQTNVVYEKINTRYLHILELTQQLLPEDATIVKNGEIKTVSIGFNNITTKNNDKLW